MLPLCGQPSSSDSTSNCQCCSSSIIMLLTPFEFTATQNSRTHGMLLTRNTSTLSRQWKDVSDTLQYINHNTCSHCIQTNSTRICVALHIALLLCLMLYAYAQTVACTTVRSTHDKRRKNTNTNIESALDRDKRVLRVVLSQLCAWPFCDVTTRPVDLLTVYVLTVFFRS
jgi:hypothetical protein